MERAYCKHQHVFHVPKKEAEGRVLLVFLLTLAFMFVEIASGYIFGSVALLADGIHMGTHALAFGISFTAYMLARRWSRDVSFSFGTWKVEVLGAYTSAVLLSMMAFLVLIEALSKLINRVAVKYEEALLVAFGGLLINLVSAFVLSHEEDHKHDVNLKSAYLHVLTDALTSILAIGALLGGKYFGMWYLDPLSGIVGFFVIINWAYGLLKETAWILLDREMRSPIVQRIINSIERDGISKVQDIHLLRIHHDKYACILTITTTQDLPADDYVKRLEEIENLVHTTVEVVYCTDSVDKNI